MKTFAILNQKGGSGKTTTSVNLAAALGEKKQRILVIDLDAQASASLWFGVKNAGKGLLEVFSGNGNLIDNVHQTDFPGVSIVPASSWLIGIEKALAGEVGVETILKQKIEALEHNWDYILLDCPPTIGVLTINALVAAHEILIPVEAHFMALSGLAQLMKTFDMVKNRLNGNLTIKGILPCRVDARTRHSKDVIEELRKHFGEKVLNTVIRENISLAEAPSFNQPITSYASKSAGAKDYRALAGEFIKN